MAIYEVIVPALLLDFVACINRRIPEAVFNQFRGCTILHCFIYCIMAGKNPNCPGPASGQGKPMRAASTTERCGVGSAWIATWRIAKFLFAVGMTTRGIL
jgi:hypothetical protein